MHVENHPIINHLLIHFHFLISDCGDSGDASILVGGRCFYYFFTPATWDAAKDQCEMDVNGGQLAMLNTDEINDAVRTKLESLAGATDHAWFGLRRRGLTLSGFYTILCNIKSC